jgi:hypothetical protein
MTIEGAFRMVEVLKGPPPIGGKIRSLAYNTGNCTIPIMAGSDYLFFVYTENSLISYPGGSRLLLSLHEHNQDQETRQLLRSLRQLRDGLKPAE